MLAIGHKMKALNDWRRGSEKGSLLTTGDGKWAGKWVQGSRCHRRDKRDWSDLFEGFRGTN